MPFLAASASFRAPLGLVIAFILLSATKFLFCTAFKALLNAVDALTGAFLLILVACLLLVAGLFADALTAFLGAVCVALCCCRCLDTVALLLDAVVFLLVGAFFLGAAFLGAALLALDTVALLLDALVVVLVFLLLEGADLLVVVLLDLVLELVRLDLFCLLLDRRPRRPPLLAIVFLVNTFVVPLNDRALTG